MNISASLSGERLNPLAEIYSLARISISTSKGGRRATGGDEKTLSIRAADFRLGLTYFFLFFKTKFSISFLVLLHSLILVLVFVLVLFI